MHEASLVQGLLKIVKSHVDDYNAANPNKKVAAIKEIRCSAGLLACFEPQALRACFEIFAEGTLAEHADLLIDTMPLKCRCDSCGASFELLSRHFICPQCGNDNLTFTGGNGLVLQAVNVECEDSND